MQVQNDIRTELEQLGSSLAGMPRLNPFAVPEGYFEQVPAQVINALATEKNIAALPRENPFDVPAHYFDGFSDEVLKEVKTDKPATKILSLGSAVRWAAAAVLVLGVGMGVMKLSQPPTPSFDQQLGALPEETVQEYFVQTGEEAELAGNLAMANIPVQELSDEEIQQYLEETNF